MNWIISSGLQWLTFDLSLKSKLVLNDRLRGTE